MSVSLPKITNFPQSTQAQKNIQVSSSELLSTFNTRCHLPKVKDQINQTQQSGSYLRHNNSNTSFNIQKVFNFNLTAGVAFSNQEKSAIQRVQDRINLMRYQLPGKRKFQMQNSNFTKSKQKRYGQFHSHQNSPKQQQNGNSQQNFDINSKLDKNRRNRNLFSQKRQISPDFIDVDEIQQSKDENAESLPKRDSIQILKKMKFIDEKEKLWNVQQKMRQINNMINQNLFKQLFQ